MTPIEISILMSDKYTLERLADEKMVPFKSGGFCSEVSLKKLVDAKEIKVERNIVDIESLIAYIQANFPDVRISRIYS